MPHPMMAPPHHMMTWPVEQPKSVCHKCQIPVGNLKKHNKRYHSKKEDGFKCVACGHCESNLDKNRFICHLKTHRPRPELDDCACPVPSGYYNTKVCRLCQFRVFDCHSLKSHYEKCHPDIEMYATVEGKRKSDDAIQSENKVRIVDYNSYQNLAQQSVWPPYSPWGMMPMPLPMPMPMYSCTPYPQRPVTPVCTPPVAPKPKIATATVTSVSSAPPIPVTDTATVTTEFPSVSSSATCTVSVTPPEPLTTTVSVPDLGGLNLNPIDMDIDCEELNAFTPLQFDKPSEEPLPSRPPTPTPVNMDTALPDPLLSITDDGTWTEEEKAEFSSWGIDFVVPQVVSVTPNFTMTKNAPPLDLCPEHTKKSISLTVKHDGKLTRSNNPKGTPVRNVSFKKEHEKPLALAPTK